MQVKNQTLFKLESNTKKILKTEGKFVSSFQTLNSGLPKSLSIFF